MERVPYLLLSQPRSALRGGSLDGVQRTLYAPKDGAALRRSYATANCNPCRCHQSRHCEKAEACPGTTARKLDWLASLYVRDETYAKALAELVKHHHRHAFAEHWGEGKTSSSDGQRFRAGGRGEAAGQVNLRYGNEPGFTFLHAHFGPVRAVLQQGDRSERSRCLRRVALPRI